MESEFNKNFRQQMQNYLKDNNTALVLDGLQKEVSGKAGKTGWGVEEAHKVKAPLGNLASPPASFS